MLKTLQLQNRARIVTANFIAIPQDKPQILLALFVTLMTMVFNSFRFENSYVRASDAVARGDK